MANWLSTEISRTFSVEISVSSVNCAETTGIHWQGNEIPSSTSDPCLKKKLTEMDQQTNKISYKSIKFLEEQSGKF